jgi:flagellar biosynthesis/type III secretory pathway protein FliH
MELSPLYLQRLEDATQRGMQQGMQQGIQEGIQRAQRLMVENLLQAKFSEIDEELAQIIQPLIQLEPIEIARLIMQLDRPELLAHFEQKNPPES